MHTVGYLDVEKYSLVSKKLQTREVIITGERIRHIQERRPEDYKNSMIHFWHFGDISWEKTGKNPLQKE